MAQGPEDTPMQVDEPKEQPPPPQTGMSKGNLPPPPGSKRERRHAPKQPHPTDAEADAMGGEADSSSSEEEEDDGDGQGALVVFGGDQPDVNRKLLGKGGVEAVVMRDDGEEMGFDFDDTLRLRSVVPDSPAAAAGLGRLLGMQLKHVNGEEVTSPLDLPNDFLTANALVLGLAPAPPQAPSIPNLRPGGALVPMGAPAPPMVAPGDLGFIPTGVPKNLPAVPWDGVKAPLPKRPEIKVPPLARIPRALSGRFVALPKQEEGQVVPVCVAGGVPEQRPPDMTKRVPFYLREGPGVTSRHQMLVGHKPYDPRDVQFGGTQQQRREEEETIRYYSAMAPSRTGDMIEVTAATQPLPESARIPGGQLRFDAGAEIPLPNNHEVLQFKPIPAGEAPQPSAPHGKGPGWTPKPPPSMHPDRGLMFDPDRERGTAPGGSTCLSVGRRFHGQTVQEKSEREDQTSKFQGQYASEWGETADGHFVPGKTGASYVPGRGRQDGSGMGNATSARINSARPPPTSTPGEEIRFGDGCEMLSFGESLLDIHLTVPGTAAHDRKTRIDFMKKVGGSQEEEEEDPGLAGAMLHPLTGQPIDERDFHAVPNRVLEARAKDPTRQQLALHGSGLTMRCGEMGGLCPAPAPLNYQPAPPLTEADKNRLIANFRSRHNIPDEFEYAMRGLDSEGLRSVLRPLLDAGRDPTTVLTARINLEKRRIRSEQLKIAGGNIIRENIDPKNDPMLEEAPVGHVLAMPCPKCSGSMNSFTTEEAWLCSGCDDKFGKGTGGFYGCRRCDFDLCPRCSRRAQARSAAVSAAVILAGRALEALADAWEHAKRRQAQRKRAEKRQREHELLKQTNPALAALPFQPGMDIDVIRTNGTWSPGTIKAVKENMGTAVYIVTLEGEGNFLKQIPVKKAEGRIRMRAAPSEDPAAKRARTDDTRSDGGLSSSRGASTNGRDYTSSRGSRSRPRSRSR